MDAVLCLHIGYAMFSMECLNMYWSDSDKCLFSKETLSCKIILVFFCHADDTLIAGTQDAVNAFKMRNL